MKIIIRYAKVPTELMDTPIPDVAPYSTTFDGDGNVRQRTLREYVFKHLTYDLPDGTTLFRLACDESGRGYRYVDGTDEKDMMDWDKFLAPYNYGEGTWLTSDEVNGILAEEFGDDYAL